MNIKKPNVIIMIAQMMLLIIRPILGVESERNNFFAERIDPHTGRRICSPAEGADYLAASAMENWDKMALQRIFILTTGPRAEEPIPYRLQGARVQLEPLPISPVRTELNDCLKRMKKLGVPIIGEMPGEQELLRDLAQGQYPGGTLILRVAGVNMNTAQYQSMIGGGSSSMPSKMPLPFQPSKGVAVFLGVVMLNLGMSKLLLMTAIYHELLHALLGSGHMGQNFNTSPIPCMEGNALTRAQEQKMKTLEDKHNCTVPHKSSSPQRDSSIMFCNPIFNPMETGLTQVDEYFVKNRAAHIFATAARKQKKGGKKRGQDTKGSKKSTFKVPIRAIPQ